MGLKLTVGGRTLFDVPVVRSGAGVAGEVRSWAELAARASDPASAGKTFHMRAGDYGTRVLTSTVGVRFLGYPGEEAGVRFTRLDLKNCRGLVVDGFRATSEVNQQASTDCKVRRARIGTVEADGYGTALTGSSLNGCTRCGFEYCDMTGEQILETAYALNTDCWAKGCSFHHPRTDCCWTWWCNGMLWEDCEFHHIVEHGPHNDGIQLANDTSVAGAKTQNITVRGCYFHDNTSQCIFMRGGVFPNVTVENCLAVRCVGGFQSWAFFGVDGLTLRGNTAWDGGNQDISVRQDNTAIPNRRVTLERNVAQQWNLADPALGSNMILRRHNVGGPGFSPAGTDLVVQTPLFRDVKSDDYRLRAPLRFPDGVEDLPGVDWAPAMKQFGPGW